MNKNKKNSFLFPPRSRRKSRDFLHKYTRVQFFYRIRIWTHNLNLASTLPYHWATPSHVTNNEIFSFYHHFLMSYITCFTAIRIPNEKLFNYKVVDLVASYNFRIYFFPSEVIWKFWKFEIQNLNHIFGCQNNLNWKKFELQSCRFGWGIQLLYRLIFDLRQFKFFKNRMFKY